MIFINWVWLTHDFCHNTASVELVIILLIAFNQSNGQFWKKNYKQNEINSRKGRNLATNLQIWQKQWIRGNKTIYDIRPKRKNILLRKSKRDEKATSVTLYWIQESQKRVFSHLKESWNLSIKVYKGKKSKTGDFYNSLLNQKIAIDFLLARQICYFFYTAQRFAWLICVNCFCCCCFCLVWSSHLII